MIAEIIVLVLAALAAIVIFKALKRVFVLVINSIVGLALLWFVNILGIHVAINLLSVLIVAIGGVAGLLLVVLLHLLGIAF